MKKLSLCVFTAAIFLFVAAISLSFAQMDQAKTGPFEISRLIKATAKVEAVDQKNREVTLKGPNGPVDIKVGEEVRNFSQIKPGDLVNVAYYESLSAQLYKKGEKLPPGIQAKQFMGRAAPGELPAGAVGREVTLATEVEGIDKKNNTVTLKTQDGSVAAYKVRDPKNLDMLSVGDHILFKLTQAAAVSVEKAS